MLGSISARPCFVVANAGIRRYSKGMDANLFTPIHGHYNAHKLTLSGLDESAFARSLTSARVQMNPHQVEAALFALKSPLSKGVLLADEVGLGKTIEAGLVLSQRWAEHKRRIILIVPASLRKQWQQELFEKFSLRSEIMESATYKAVQKQGHFHPFAAVQGIIICSYEFAARKADELRSIAWDLVVFDEAHRLRNVFKKDGSPASTPPRSASPPAAQVAKPKTRLEKTEAKRAQFQAKLEAIRAHRAGLPPGSGRFLDAQGKERRFEKYIAAFDAEIASMRARIRPAEPEPPTAAPAAFPTSPPLTTTPAPSSNGQDERAALLERLRHLEIQGQKFRQGSPKMHRNQIARIEISRKIAALDRRSDPMAPSLPGSSESRTKQDLLDEMLRRATARADGSEPL